MARKFDGLEPGFAKALENFLEEVNKRYQDYIKKAGFEHKGAACFDFEKLQKFVRVFETQSDGVTPYSVHCFVALQAGETKVLGSYNEGDIFYPGGYRAPAKIVRGNIYENDGKGALLAGRHEIRTLR